jgi:hypothetical protein
VLSVLLVLILLFVVVSLVVLFVLVSLVVVLFGWMVRVRRYRALGVDDRACGIELDAARKRPWPRRGRNGAPGKGVPLLVVCVLFQLFVIGIVQYLEFLLDRRSVSPQFIPSCVRERESKREELGR